MSYFLNKWASMKVAGGLSLPGAQDKNEQAALKPLPLEDATKGKPPVDAAKQVDTTPKLGPIPPDQPVSDQTQSGDVSTITPQPPYAKMAGIEGLLNCLKLQGPR